MIKAIIFDVDNTLIKFTEIAVKCFQDTAKELSLKYYPAKEISKYFGTPAVKFIPKLWPNSNFKEFHKKVIQKIKSKKVKSIPGAVNVIKQLSKNYKLGLLSSKSRKLMYYQLKQVKLSPKYFKFIYSSEDINYPKPDPRAFSKPIKKLKLKPQEILYIGDAIFDCTSAQKAGLNFVAVLTGVYSKKDFKKHKVKNRNILKSVSLLPNWIDKNG